MSTTSVNFSVHIEIENEEELLLVRDAEYELLEKDISFDAGQTIGMPTVRDWFLEEIPENGMKQIQLALDELERKGLNYETIVSGDLIE